MEREPDEVLLQVLFVEVQLPVIGIFEDSKKNPAATRIHVQISPLEPLHAGRSRRPRREPCPFPRCQSETSQHLIHLSRSRDTRGCPSNKILEARRCIQSDDAGAAMTRSSNSLN